MGYSPEYIIKVFQALVLALLTLAGMFGWKFTDNDRAVVAGGVAALVNAVLFIMTVITMIRQKRKEQLTALGSYTTRTPVNLLGRYRSDHP